MNAMTSPRFTRRDFLHRTAAGFGMVGLSGLLGSRAFAEGAPRQTHFAPKAKRVIFLFLNGGPSHVDTFDPKPALKTHEGKQPTGNLYKNYKGTGFVPSPLAFGNQDTNQLWKPSRFRPALSRPVEGPNSAVPVFPATRILVFGM